MGDGEQVLREMVLPRLHGVRKVTQGFQALCPAHDDSSPSLSVSVGDKQPVIFTCHAGCDPDMILTELDLTWSELSQPRERRREGEWVPGGGTAAAVYDYRDEQGELLYQVLRIPEPGGKKTFRQRTPDPTAKSGWRWSLGDVRRVPYRLPELIAAVDAGEVVWIAEGEKDVHTLLAQGVPAATCNSGGAGKWAPEFAEFFRDANVCIVADADKPGQAHARQVAATLIDVAGSVTVLEPTEGKDVTDHIAAGRTLADLQTTWTDQGEPAPVLAPDLHEFLAEVDPPPDWVLPGLLERGDRLIWTGFEGLGKSYVTRQLAVAAAAGLHPFLDEHFPPQRVLFIDCENSERQGRRHFRKFERTALLQGRRVPDKQMFLIHRPEGIDLSRDEDAAWLLERVTAHTPDLLVCGPFYRLHAADSEEERSARKVVAALDRARIKADCALIVEHHAPHGAGIGKRSVRPFGSSLLLRWPELGMGIVPANDEMPCRQVAVRAWRGSRDQRSWPRALRWGDTEFDWPWIAAEDGESG